MSRLMCPILVFVLACGEQYASDVVKDADVPKDAITDVDDGDASVSSDAATPADASTDGSVAGCVVGLVPPALREPPYSLDVFYQKHCDFFGLPIVASNKASDEALEQAWRIVEVLTAKDRARILAGLADAKIRVAVMAATEVTTDIPEHSDLNEAFPGTDWDERARGLGATLERPAISGAEENLLCFENDRYAREDILVHEFGHTVHQFGMNSDFDARLQKLFSDSGQAKWAGLYAGSDYREYWAEGTQSWFDLNDQAEPPNGIHNHVNTRSELLAFDPGLHVLLAEVYPSSFEPFSCHEAIE